MVERGIPYVKGHRTENDFVIDVQVETIGRRDVDHPVLVVVDRRHFTVHHMHPLHHPPESVIGHADEEPRQRQHPAIR